MESSNEAISVRVSRLNSQLLAKNTSRDVGIKAISRDTLLDAFTLLYDECNNDSLKTKDNFIAKFVDKYRPTIAEMKKSRVNLSDFEVKNTIGRGNFGQVNVVEEKLTGDIYAMKTIRKWDSLKTKALSFEEERDIMSLSTSPWLTSLQYAFQDSSHLYLVMEFHPGGEILTVLEKQGGRLPEHQAVFYLSELIEAVHALHCMGYVHRDVKPENILLDSTGHIKLVDFGSAAELGPNHYVNNEDVVPVGTSDYIAVEVLKSAEASKTKVLYGSECDYWSIGVIAYEFVLGYTPFSSTNVLETYNKIMNYSEYLEIPSYVNLSKNYVDLIFSLITDQESRLNYRQILDHPLFKNTDWTSLRDQLPPFIPEVFGADDASNFVSPNATESCPNIENFITRNQFSGRNLPFVGFTYTNSITRNLTEYPVEILEAEIRQKNRRKTELEEKSLIEFLKREFSFDYQELENKLKTVEAERRELEEMLAVRDLNVANLSRELNQHQDARAELENETLKIAAATKSDWEKKEKEMLEHIENLTNVSLSKVVKLSTENEKLSSDVQQYINKLSESEAKIQNLETTVTSQEKSLTKFHRLNKKIKTTAKLQKTRIKAKRDIKFKKLKCRIEILAKKNIKLKNEINHSSKAYEMNLMACGSENEQLRNKIKELESALKTSCEELASEKNSHKVHVDRLAKTLSEFETLLQKEKKNYEKLTVEVEFMEQKHTSLLKEEHRMREREKLKYETEIQTVEGKLKDATKQIENFNNMLESVHGKDTESIAKENKLQALLDRLENGMKRWNTDVEEESSYQKQIEQLSTQIKELQEASVAETKSRRDALLKLWRSEKELSNYKVEKRDLERNLKKKDDQIKLLNDEVKSKQEELTKIQTLHEQIVTKCNDEFKTLEEKHKTLFNSNSLQKDELESYKGKYEGEHHIVVQITEQLSTALSENKSLRDELQSEISNKNNFTKELDSTRNMLRKLENLVTKTKATAEKYKTELQDVLKQNKSLTETCALLDGQLHVCDEILSKNEEQVNQLNKEIQQLKQEKQCISEEVKKLAIALELERKEKAHSARVCDEMEQKVQCLQEEVHSYEDKLTEYMDAINKGNAKVKQLEERQDDHISFETKLKKRCVELEAELTRSKIECSARLTTIHKLRESNYLLKGELKDIKEDNENLMTKLTEQHAHIQQQTDFYKEREIKSNATIGQQKKLIDFLQTKLNSEKKKKETRLFGSHKKENIPPFIKSNSKAKKHLQFPFTKTKKNVNLEHESSEFILDTPRKVAFSEAPTNSHKFVRKSSTATVKCDVCTQLLDLNADAYTCIECDKTVHSNCQNDFKLKPCKQINSSVNKNDDFKNDVELVRMEGWIQFRSQVNKKDWHRRYARLEDSVLALYNQELITNSSAVLKLDLCSETDCITIYEEVFADEVEDATETELSLILRIELISNSMTSTPKSYFIMAECESDKEYWVRSLNDLLFEKQLYPEEKKYNVIIKLDQKVEPNCLQKLSKNVFLLGCEEGLFAKVDENNLLYIAGAECVDQMCVVKSVNLVVMIVGKNRNLVEVPLLNLSSLVQCAPCTEPKFKYTCITNEDGFLLFEVSDEKQHQYLCAATTKHLLLLKYDIKAFDFVLLRKLDTAEPVSCILFKEHSVIVGADKFFKIDLKTFVADEFLKNSHRDFVEIADCYKRDSFPQGIIQLGNDPCEFLLCFNECGIFVDEFGRRSRNGNLKWSRLPVMFSYCSPHLYVCHFTAVEIITLTPEMGKNEETWINANRDKIEFTKPKCLGKSSSGVYISTSNEIVHLSAVTDDSSNESEIVEDYKSDSGTEFSFSSSIVNSLDRGSTESEQDL